MNTFFDQNQIIDKELYQVFDNDVLLISFTSKKDAKKYIAKNNLTKATIKENCSLTCFRGALPIIGNVCSKCKHSKECF